MFDKMHMPFWQFLIVVVILFAHGNVMAEEVGKTPEGNVIYRFRCPGAVNIAAKLNLNWPNHLSDHPKWDIDGSGSSERSVTARARRHNPIKRSGQVLMCDYKYEIEGASFSGQFSYKYKVKRDIISCKNSIDTLECILKPSMAIMKN